MCSWGPCQNHSHVYLFQGYLGEFAQLNPRPGIVTDLSLYFFWWYKWEREENFDKVLLSMTVEFLFFSYYLFDFLFISFCFNNFMLKEWNIHGTLVSREWCNTFQWGKSIGADYEWGCGQWASSKCLRLKNGLTQGLM